MKKILVLLLLGLLLSARAFAAISANTIWELNASGSANMVAGGGFNPANAGMLADLTTDANTANTSSPVVSSASYNFAAGDVNNWLYIKSGTNWTPGFYKIASVAANKATLSAAIGAAVQLNTTYNRYQANTVVGCATVGTPTAGTFTIDYSQTNTPIVNGIADFGAVLSSTTLTSATAGFTPVMVGNIFHQTTTGTGGFGVVGWYEIATYVNATTVTLDRTPNVTAASVACTGYIGGTLALNSTLDDDWHEIIIGGNFVYAKSGSYTFGEIVAVSSTSGTATNPVIWEGYSTIRGDNLGKTRATSTNPTISGAGSSHVFGQFQNYSYINFTGNGTTAFTGGASSRFAHFKATNTSNAAGRVAWDNGAGGTTIDAELVSQLGVAFNGNSNDSRLFYSYIHDSDICVRQATSRQTFEGNLIVACRTAGFNATSASPTLFSSNTLYGYLGTPRGKGISISASVGPIKFYNNIISNWSTGISGTTAQVYSNEGEKNNFYGNTTDVSLYNKDITDTAINPSFTNVAELTGSTATTSGSVLTQSGGDFSTVTDNVDYCQIHSGTGITVGSYLITSHTATTVTLNIAPGTNATTDKVWTILTTKNFGIASGLKAGALPGAIGGTATTNYKDVGAVQRQESGSGFIIT